MLRHAGWTPSPRARGQAVPRRARCLQQPPPRPPHETRVARRTRRGQPTQRGRKRPRATRTIGCPRPTSASSRRSAACRGSTAMAQRRGKRKPWQSYGRSSGAKTSRGTWTHRAFARAKWERLRERRRRGRARKGPRERRRRGRARKGKRTLAMGRRRQPLKAIRSMTSQGQVKEPASTFRITHFFQRINSRSARRSGV